MSVNNLKVNISNFKSIESKNISFKNEMRLVKGGSGTGKSTILDAIMYAITGHPKTCKPLGTNKATKVELEFDHNSKHIKITRSTRPCRLTLARGDDPLIEDDEAQACINAIFGSSFDVVSHLPQDSSSAFIRQRPQEKLDFLEQSVCGNQAAQAKKQAKLHLRECKTNVARCEAEYETRERDLKQFRMIDKPIQKLPERPTEKTIELVAAEKAKNRKHVNRVRDEIECLESEENTLRKNAEKFKDEQIRKKALKSEIEDLEKRLNDKASDLGIETLSDDTIDECVNQSRDAVLASQKMRDLKRSLPDFCSEQSDIEKNNEAWHKKQVRKLKDLDTELAYVQSKECYTLDCPSCSSKISFNTQTEVASICEAKSSCEVASSRTASSIMRDKSRIEAKIELRKKDTLRALKVWEQINELDAEWGHCELSDASGISEVHQDATKIQSDWKRLNKKKARLNTLKNTTDPTENIEKRLSEIMKDLHCKKRELRLHNTAWDTADQELQTLQLWDKSVQEHNSKMQEWERQVNHKKDLVKRRDEASIKLKSACESLKGAEELKQAIAKAESLAITNIVDKINETAAKHLDDMFVDDPIDVHLQTFTQAKTGKKKIKPEIRAHIQYKENEMKLNGLSGGEKARVAIAFNLALCEIFDSPIVMLDEVTANLDADLAETVCECVKQAAPDKIVLVVAHQCVDGIFDSILHMQ